MLFPSEQWLGEWVARCNADPYFRSVGRGWQGAAGCVVKSVGTALPESLYLRLEGQDGQWHSYRLGSSPLLVDEANFVLSADYEVWKSVIQQRTHPVRAMVQGRVRVRGQLSVVLRWTQPLLRMTELAGLIQTSFLDEADPR